MVAVENSLRHLAEAQGRLQRPLTVAERLKVVFESSEEARRPILFGQLISMVVYLPIFALTGIEGKMFHPMALTVVMALLGAMILSITFVPAAVALFVSGRVSEKENTLMQLAKKAYLPALDFALRNRPLVVTTAVVIVVLSGLLGTRLGTEFVPALDEGDISVQPLRAPGTGLTQSIAMQAVLNKDFENSLNLHLPVQGLWLPQGWPAGLHRRALCPHWWGAGPVAARHPAFHLRRGRVHCSLRRGGAQRPGDDHLHPPAA